ncbi:flagellar filament capping protein FliD [Candidatus Marinarcus aquaticus]|uniref:Flagellar hook-associated protein 2 n=1 Tax=Candidatus Marinarcus aquaticus TaxID=2044504 RepID=A0A4Q0XQ60_9BACT|nr:flagellar filament capping protein FliD [Candidatus Marinarcus aquaticus]RXJ56377.1 flagellar hook protein FliD [Candidatus Marinarcus aquaticus]
MADGILGLGSSGSTGLNQELIDKLKEAERKARVQPIETRLEDWDTEVEQFGEFEAKVNELLAIAKEFDLFKNGANAFEQIFATTSGTAVAFDAADTSKLKPGTINVEVTQLAQKDVYQSSIIADKTATMDAGTISISVGGDTPIDFDTTGKTYEQIVAEMNNYPSLDASLEQVGDSEYRLIIKSGESGLSNALDITQSGGVNIGLGNSVVESGSTIVGTDIPTAGQEITVNGVTFVADGNKTYNDIASEISSDGSINVTASISDGKFVITSDDGSAISITNDTMLGLEDKSQTLTAQNMLATVDGIDYNLSSNQITMQNGLTISALEVGTGSISMQQDTANIETKMQELVTKYNELNDIVSNYTISADSKIEDKATLRSVMSQVKDILFGAYGENDEKSIFSYGFNLDKSGHITIDSTEFNKAVTDDLDGLKSLFIGVAEDRGIGTKLKEYLDDLDSFEGLLTVYGDAMSTRKDNLEEEKTKAIEALDSKYAQLANQFAAYTAIISKFESAFGGLQMMIAQSKASN